ncbi:60S ribosomal protein L22-2 [Acorus gramineus]|uniref:60S ribosomal protein L22-2 n=1 Tax=Acorus gramineus TaxID=55184 RepID=A0AAV9BWU5_ACOGR|nr:60S ribosomal protein L22-2 [Acorus gramineus]
MVPEQPVAESREWGRRKGRPLRSIERIKVFGGKAGNLSDSITVSRDKNKIIVVSNSNFSKRKLFYIGHKDKPGLQRIGTAFTRKSGGKP